MSRRAPADLNIVAAFYKRWAPHEDSRRRIADDHKEMFAEAKAEGLNPKALRKAFAEQYRVENQTADQAEKRSTNDADFELYLSALARVREYQPEHDADGVIIEPQISQHRSSETTGAVPTKASAGANTGGENVAAHQLPNTTDVLKNDDGKSGDGRLAPISDVEPVAPHSPPVTIPPVVPSIVVTEAGDRSVAIPPAAAPVVASYVTQLNVKKRWTFNDPAHRDCLDPGMCGGFSNLKLCQRCREAAEAGQVA